MRDMGPSEGVRAVQRAQMALARLGARITAEASAAGAAGVTENHDVQVLLTLLLEGPTRPGRLAEVTRITTGGMTALLDRLEGVRLLRREAGHEGDDRRTLLVALTPAGIRAAHALAGATRDALAGRPPEAIDLLAALRTRSTRPDGPLDVERAARIMLDLADRSEAHTREVLVAAVEAGIRGLDALPGRRTYSVCCLIDLFGAQSPGAIAAHVARSPATATRLVQTLEAVGLVRRVPADPPRRGKAYDVDLTAAGRRAARLVDRPTPALRDLGRTVAAAMPGDGPERRTARTGSGRGRRVSAPPRSRPAARRA